MEAFYCEIYKYPAFPILNLFPAVFNTEFTLKLPGEFFFQVCIFPHKILILWPGTDFGIFKKLPWWFYALPALRTTDLNSFFYHLLQSLQYVSYKVKANSLNRVFLLSHQTYWFLFVVVVPWWIRNSGRNARPTGLHLSFVLGTTEMNCSSQVTGRKYTLTGKGKLCLNSSWSTQTVSEILDIS